MSVQAHGTALTHYDTMCHAIAVCHQVDEVKEIHNKALAMELYAKQAMNIEAERKACEVRLRAERRAGELLSEKERTTPRDANLSGKARDPSATVADGSEYRATIEQAGIPERTARRWQKLASVPAPDFEAALAAPDKPSTNGILRRQREPAAPEMDEAALWLWGRLRDFERRALLSRDADEILNEMTETMQADCRRIAPMLAEWLGGIE